MSNFVKALIFTAVPLVAASLIAIAFPSAWIGAGILFAAAIVSIVVFAIRGQRRIVLGVLVGAAIGVVSMGVSCFAMALGF